MARFPPAVPGGSRSSAISAWSVLLETSAFLLKASELHSNLMKDIKQTALKKSHNPRKRERERENLTRVFFISNAWRAGERELESHWV